MSIEDIISTLKQGSIFWDFDYKYHIVDIISDEKGKVFVFRYFGKHRQYWHYEVKTEYQMYLCFKWGQYSTIKKPKQGDKQS